VLLRTVPLIVVASLALARSTYTQVPADNEKVQTPSNIARGLVDQRAVVPVPAQGKVKLSIKKEAERFTMSNGLSSVVLLQLPDYKAPYVMRIASSRRGIGRTTELFVPSGIYLDADLRQVDEFGEHQLAGRVESLVAELGIDGSRMNARYLLLYTDGDLVGQQVVLHGQDALDDAIGSLFQKGLFRVERSLEASLEVETKMRPGYADVQTMTQSEVARFLLSQGAVVRVPSAGTVKPSIAAGAPTFMLEGGPSTAVLLEMPDYSAPYSLKIKSSVQRSKGIFIPSGFYFDASFQQVGDFGEDRLTGKESVTADLGISERDRVARYLLLYTRGDLAGLSVQRRGFTATGPLYWVERSLEAKLEVETKPSAGMR